MAIAENEADWVNLDKYHYTITRSEFTRLLDKVYCPSKAIHAYLTIQDDLVDFYEDAGKTNLTYTLYFSLPGKDPQPVHRGFKTLSELRQRTPSPGKPLEGLNIAIDPGHIGGKWASMEERSVAWNDKPIIREGDANLIVAKRMRKRLQEAGATIFMTHETSDPVTPTRPKDHMEEAKMEVMKENKMDDAQFAARKDHWMKKVIWLAEMYFYRKAEIAERAKKIRMNFSPDFTICNHFNATELSGSGEITDDNRHIFFLNGCYGPKEVDNPVTRYHLFAKLLEQGLPIEMGMGNCLTKKILRASNLPPPGIGQARFYTRVNENPYLYARNLAATRQYPGPCLLLEAFYMNNPMTAEWMTSGEYEGERLIAGVMRPNIYSAYAKAMCDGIIEYYSSVAHSKAGPPKPVQVTSKQ